MKKLLTVLGATIALGTVSANAAEECDHGGAMFAARGAETQRITIGGYIQTAYQWVDTNDEIEGTECPEEYNNFLMSHIRLYVRAELGCGWSALMNIDFAGESGQYFGDFVTPTANTGAGQPLERSCECKDQCKIYVDKAYIQKVWCDSTWRFGYQKVQWGAEWNTPEPHLKTIERSVATNFFQNLGKRVSGINGTDLLWTGEKLGQRKVGVYLAGQQCDFHYSAAVTNGYDGLCMNSTEKNNSLAFYASLAYETTLCDFDVLFGVNTAYMDKGTNLSKNPNCSMFGFNPYALVNWNRMSLLAEAYWAEVEGANLVKSGDDACPWGVNLIPSYMINDCLEFVGRFSYVNSDQMGMIIHNTFGCAPETSGNRIASNELFEKVYAGYLGVNYYMLNGAVKASLGLEQAKFKNRGVHQGGGVWAFSTPGSEAQHKGAKVNSVRAALQLVF